MGKNKLDALAMRSTIKPVNIKQYSLPFRSLEKLRDDLLHDDHPRRRLFDFLIHLFNNEPEFEAQRRQYTERDPRWIIEALVQGNNNITKWIIRDFDEENNKWQHPVTIDGLLTLYKDLCLYLLERSAFLGECKTNDERDYAQQLLSSLAESAGQYKEALDKISHDCHEQFIEQMLDNMKRSGYIYHPHKQFKILTTIFKISPSLINEKMSDIFDAIWGWNRSNWQNEPFRGAFVEMLEMFINDNCDLIDELAGLEEKVDNDRYTMMVQALAVQLLLAVDSDKIDLKRNRAMFYRYLMIQPAVNRHNLSTKAMAMICGLEPYANELKWEEAKNVTKLGLTLGFDSLSIPAAMPPLRYRSANIQLLLGHDGITIAPVDNLAACHSVLPNDIFPLDDMRVLLFDSVKTPPAKKLKDIKRLREMWKEVEESLFDGTTLPQAQQGHKVLPEPGDIVHIVIDSTEMNDDYMLHCTIEDEIYYGEGWINVKKIVRWFSIDMDLSFFIDRNSGKYLLFEARVVDVDADYGDYTFEMNYFVDEYIRNSVNYGDYYEAVIVNRANANQYTCLSREGYSFWTAAKGEFDSLPKSTFVQLRVTDIKSGNTMYAEITRILDDTHKFTHDTPFRNLMKAIGDVPQVSVVSRLAGEISGDNYTDLSQAMMRQLILLVRKNASFVPEDYVGTFNYLAMATLMARMAGDKQQETLCRNHIDLLELLSYYDTNESLKTDSVTSYAQLANAAPTLQRLYNMLLTVSYIDNHAAADNLWQIVNGNNANEARLAQLVLSLNMLADETVKEQKNLIKTRIKELLRVSNLNATTAKYYGSESLHAEFKSSIIYPAGNSMQRDDEKQLHKILEVVCGFLNADGGTLYLGVRDNGFENGLDQDMKVFKTRDKFDLYVRNNIHDRLGSTANLNCDAHWDSGTNHDVYILEIKKCRHLISLDDTVWVRQGTSTRPIAGRDLVNYREDREQEFLMQRSKAMQNATADVADEVTAPTIEATLDKVETSVSRADDIVPISTGQRRANVLHNYEDGFVDDVAGYIYFKPGNRFEFSKKDLYKEDECQLSIALHDSETDGYLVMVYDNGEVVKIAMREMTDKRPGQDYNYGSGNRLIFACPAAKTDGLFLIIRDNKDIVSYRVDRVSEIVEDNANSTGERLFEMPFKQILLCEIVPQEKFVQLADGMNLNSRQVGAVIKRGTASVDDAVKALVALATN